MSFSSARPVPVPPQKHPPFSPVAPPAKPLLLQFQPKPKPKPGNYEEICRGLKRLGTALLLTAVLLLSNPISTPATPAAAVLCAPPSAPDTAGSDVTFDLETILILISLVFFLSRAFKYWRVYSKRDMVTAKFQFAFPGSVATALLPDLHEDHKAVGSPDVDDDLKDVGGPSPHWTAEIGRMFAIRFMSTLLRHKHNCISIEPEWHIENSIVRAEKVLVKLNEDQDTRVDKWAKLVTDEYIFVSILLVFEGSLEMPHIGKDKKKAMENVLSLIRSIPSSKLSGIT